MYFLEFNDTLYNLLNARKIKVTTHKWATSESDDKVVVEIDGDEMEINAPQGLAEEVAIGLKELIKDLMTGGWDGTEYRTITLRDLSNEDVENDGIAEFLMT